MIARIKNLFKNWRADRQQLRELTIKLDALTDEDFLDRALICEFILERLHQRMLNSLLYGVEK